LSELELSDPVHAEGIASNKADVSTNAAIAVINVLYRTTTVRVLSISTRELVLMQLSPPGLSGVDLQPDLRSWLGSNNDCLFVRCEAELQCAAQTSKEVELIT
jgi:hypothetical protein